jgi:hypothetical protein
MTKCQAEELSHGDNGLRLTSVFSPPVEAFYFRGISPCRAFLFPLLARAQSIFSPYHRRRRLAIKIALFLIQFLNMERDDGGAGEGEGENR